MNNLLKTALLSSCLIVVATAGSVQAQTTINNPMVAERATREPMSLARPADIWIERSTQRTVRPAMSSQSVVSPVMTNVSTTGWAPYRSVTFEYAQTDLSPAALRQIEEVAVHLKNNPSLQLGIDGYRDQSYQNLGSHRLGAVRQALAAAGVIPARIEIGAFGENQLSRDRVELLLSTSNSPTRQSRSAP